MATKSKNKTSAKKPSSAKTKSKSKSTKTNRAARPTLTAASPRRLKPAKNTYKLPNFWQLTKESGRLIWQNRKLFIGITIIYGLLNLILVQGLSSASDITNLKNDLHSALHGNFGSFGSGLGTFVLLVGSSGNGSSQTAGAYQLPLAVIVSLAIIWSIRQVISGHKIRIRDAYYRGMYPLIPFILILLVVGVELVPLLIGSSLLSLVLTTGIAASSAEVILWWIIFILLACLSLYFICTSLMALYIVTLPDMTPISALRSAKQIVGGRRLVIIRKILWLPVVLLLVAGVIMIPIIALVSALAQWVFFILTMFSLVAIHSYMYTLYRELLNE